MITAARVVYGLSRRSQLPVILGTVEPAPTDASEGDRARRCRRLGAGPDMAAGDPRRRDIHRHSVCLCRRKLVPVSGEAPGRPRRHPVGVHDAEAARRPPPPRTLGAGRCSASRRSQAVSHGPNLGRSSPQLFRPERVFDRTTGESNKHPGLSFLLNSTEQMTYTWSDVAELLPERTRVIRGGHANETWGDDGIGAAHPRMCWREKPSAVRRICSFATIGLQCLMPSRESSVTLGLVPLANC